MSKPWATRVAVLGGGLAGSMAPTNDLYLAIFPIVIMGVTRLGWLYGSLYGLLWLVWMAGALHIAPYGRPLIIGVLAVMTIITLADVLYQRFMHHKELRMTKQQVKDEHKQSEGDPLIKARLRQIRVERARKRMMAAVPEADVVITNPTHYAVALKYDQRTMEAPRVVAKGVDNIALRIRAVAEEHDVAIVENPPVARALHASVEIDQEIPPEHYKAVAEIIGYVMRLKKGLPGRRPR